MAVLPAWRDLISERKAKLVSDTGKTLLPDRTLVREWPKIPAERRYAIRDYLLGLSTVTDPRADQKDFTGLWRTYTVTIFFSKADGWIARQSLSLGYYTSSLPTAIEVRQRDLLNTPFADVTLTENERVAEYRNIARGSVTTLKPVVGTVVSGEKIVDVSSQTEEDGSAKIFVVYRKVLYPSQEPATGGGKALSWGDPGKGAETIERTYYDLDSSTFEAVSSAMKIGPAGYAVGRVTLREDRGRGSFDVTQGLIKLDATDYENIEGPNALWPVKAVTRYNAPTAPSEDDMRPAAGEGFLYACIRFDVLEPNSAAPSYRRIYKLTKTAAYGTNDAGEAAGIRNLGEDDESRVFAYHGIVTGNVAASQAALATAPDEAEGTYTGWAVAMLDVRDHGDGTWSIYRTLSKGAVSYADWATIFCKDEKEADYRRTVIKRIDDSTIRVFREALSRTVRTTRRKKLATNFTTTAAIVTGHLSTGAGTFTQYWRQREGGGKIYEYQEEIVKGAWNQDSASVINVTA